MVRKVIFLVEATFTLRDYERFGVQLLEDNGLEVEVWDLTPVLWPQVFRDVKIADPYHGPELRIFTVLADVRNALARIDRNNVFVICLLPLRLKTLFLYNAFHAGRIRYGIVLANAMPFSTKDTRGKGVVVLAAMINRLLGRLRWDRFRRIGEVLVLRLALLFVRIQPATLLLCGGEVTASCGGRLVGPRTEILWLHAMDYDVYLTQKDLAPEPRTAVFIDEYYPFHPGFFYLGMGLPASPGDYYLKLCAFFDRIEKDHGVRVRVAAHPRSRYEQRDDYFQGREVVMGKTSEMIGKASFVIAHSSTAINFAVLFNKPVIFVTMKEVRTSPFGFFVDHMAAGLGNKIHDLDHMDALDLSGALAINAACYAKHKSDYIKKAGTPEIPFWQIFADKVKMFS